MKHDEALAKAMEMVEQHEKTDGVEVLVAMEKKQEEKRKKVKQKVNEKLQEAEDVVQPEPQQAEPEPQVRTPVKFKDVLRKDKNNLQYMEKLRIAYEKDVSDYQNNADWKRVMDQIDMLRERKAKEDERIRKQLERAEKQKAKLEGDTDAELTEAIERWVNRLADKELYFVSDENKYYHYKGEDLGWVVSGVDATYRIQGAISALDKMAFSHAMDQLGRNKHVAAYSFRNKENEDVLGLMRQEHWLQPADTDEEPHDLFRLLTLSIGGGNEEIADHIEQVVYWKYLHPEDYQIPCLVITGPGGTGKNEFVLGPLQTIFGESQVVALPFSMVFGDYTGERRGKTVVYVDEVVSSKSDAENMKAVVGNKTVSVNVKGGKQGQVENTAMYMVGGNDRSGAFLLDGTKADRRWSIISTKESIMPHIRRKYGFKLLENPGPNREDEQDAIEWFENNRYVLNDPIEVAKWLRYLIVKHSNLCKKRPSGYHGEAYHSQRMKQMTPTEEFCEIIFRDPAFTYLSSTDCWELFEFWMQKNAKKTAQNIRRNSSLKTIKEWLDEKQVDVQAACRYKVTFDEGIRSSEYGFSSGGKTSWEADSGSYLVSNSGLGTKSFGGKYKDALMNFEMRMDGTENGGDE